MEEGRPEQEATSPHRRAKGAGKAVGEESSRAISIARREHARKAEEMI